MITLEDMQRAARIVFTYEAVGLRSIVQGALEAYFRSSGLNEEGIATFRQIVAKRDWR